MDLKLTQQYSWLITGVAGFIGSHLLETLLKHNQKVIGLDNFATGKKANLEDVLNKLTKTQQDNFTFIEGDIRDLSTCEKAVKGVDYVLHQAALGSVPRSLKDPITTNDVNVTGFLNMIRAAQESQVKCFVYASSSSVYGDSPELPKVEAKVGTPLSPYAVSKKINELYANVFTRCYGLPTIGLRYFNVFGPRQDPESLYAAVIPLWIKSLLQGESCYINGDGLYSRDFCFVNNVVQANIKAALSDNSKAYGEVFNIAFGERTTLLELFDMIRENAGLNDKIKPQHREIRPGDVPHSLANLDKSKDLLKYDPQYSVHEGMKITVASYKG